MIFRDHFNYRRKFVELRAERVVMAMERMIRQVQSVRLAIVRLRNAFQRL